MRTLTVLPAWRLTGSPYQSDLLSKLSVLPCGP